MSKDGCEIVHVSLNPSLITMLKKPATCYSEPDESSSYIPILFLMRNTLILSYQCSCNPRVRRKTYQWNNYVHFFLQSNIISLPRPLLHIFHISNNGNNHETRRFIVKVKVTQSVYRPGLALRTPGG
jgi:hypothetical protein